MLKRINPNPRIYAKKYFKITFIFVFVFLFIFKSLGELFNEMHYTLEFWIKTFAVSLFTALILGAMNHFLKIDFYNKK